MLDDQAEAFADADALAYQYLEGTGGPRRSVVARSVVSESGERRLARVEWGTPGGGESNTVFFYEEFASE